MKTKGEMIYALSLAKHNIEKALDLLLSGEEITETCISSNSDLLKEVESVTKNISESDKIIISRDIFTLSDIRHIINNGLVSDLLLHHKVFIPNSESKTELWEIIGINHDGTNNTIDLRSSIAAIEDMYFDSKSNIYEDSSIRKYLNTDYYDSFSSEAKAMIQIMDVSSNGKILKDKVKLLSMTELGLDDYHSDILKGEGNPYTVTTHMLKDKEGKYRMYMTRSRGLDDSRCCIWRIDGIGHVGVNDYDYGRCAAPVIRLG